ncbi:MAG TPA: tripartite tricarboxylate transporter TctB family protein [Burkholderiales bacterium]|nr:tripartite tricarboxylate transporter TctB family protein [Burkholderiales bacterium]
MMTDRVIFACTIVIAAVYLYATTLIPSLEIGDPLGPKAFPRLLGIGLLIAAGLLFVEMWKDRKLQAPAPAAAAPRDVRHLWILAGVVVWTGVYYALLEKLGYIVDSTIYLFALMAWFNRGKWVANGLTAVLYSVLSYIMFVKLDVNLPRGVEGISGISDAVIVATNSVVNLFKSVPGFLK